MHTVVCFFEGKLKRRKLCLVLFLLILTLLDLTSAVTWLWVLSVIQYTRILYTFCGNEFSGWENFHIEKFFVRIKLHPNFPGIAIMKVHTGPIRSRDNREYNFKREISYLFSNRRSRCVSYRDLFFVRTIWEKIKIVEKADWSMCESDWERYNRIIMDVFSKQARWVKCRAIFFLYS